MRAPGDRPPRSANRAWRRPRHVAAIAALCLSAMVAARSRAQEIAFPGVGARGVFDASLEAEPRSHRIWMSYSAVEPETVGGSTIDTVSTRLALSQDRGATWTDRGAVLNQAQIEAQPPAQLSGRPAVWQHEVSRLFYDRGAPSAERWKLLWHRYLLADDGNAQTDDRQFQHGWIGLRIAATPEALVTAPRRKLFAAAGYDLDAAYNDAVIGPPEIRLGTIDPALAQCVAVSEPGAAATARGLYVSLVCVGTTPSVQRIVMLYWPYPAGPWQYLGSTLDTAMAAALDPSFIGFSAPELVAHGSRVMLIATPTVAPFGFYGGCMGFRFAARDSAALRDRDRDGRPDVQFRIAADPGGFAGACGFAIESRRSGVVLSRAQLTEPIRYHLVATGVRP